MKEIWIVYGEEYHPGEHEEVKFHNDFFTSEDRANSLRDYLNDRERQKAESYYTAEQLNAYPRPNPRQEYYWHVQKLTGEASFVENIGLLCPS